ncbi:MAG: hypothetical protein ABIM49_01390 [candidate division WOR-3 bacterium]
MNFFAFSLIMGSLWGIGEILIWNFLKILNIGIKSPFVFAYGIFILTLSRKIYDKKGISLLIGLIAISFKFLNSSIFLCQFVAVLIEAICFEIGFLLIPYFKNFYRILIPLFSTYFSFAGFAFSIVYILKMEGWVKRGKSGIIHYITVNGSLAFLFSILAFNLALLLYNHIFNKKTEKIIILFKKYGLKFSILFFILSWIWINL